MCCTWTELNDYYLAGVALAMAVVHEGPAPHCLSSALFDALVLGADRVSVPFDEMPPCQLKSDIEMVSAVLDS